MLLFDEKFKTDLYLRAETSPRLRAHHNIHNSFDEPVQRLAIALLKGSYIPPHMHVQPHQWEFFHVVEGRVKLILFSDEGMVTATHLLGDGQESFAVQLPPGTLHTLVCLSERACVFEWKQGPYEPERAKSSPSWSVAEESENAGSELIWLERASVGDKFS